jgi:hypothetical protein
MRNLYRYSKILEEFDCWIKNIFINLSSCIINCKEFFEIQCILSNQSDINVWVIEVLKV